MRTLALAILATLCLHVGVAAAEPLATFTPANFEFGKIEVGDPGKATVTVKNTGDEPLIIKAAKPSCSACLKVTAPTEPLMPGESASIVAVYDTRASGPIAKSVALTLNTVTGAHILTTRGYVNAPADPANGFAPKP